MKRILPMKKMFVPLSIAAVLCAAHLSVLQAQVLFEGDYSQDFDSLPLYESNSGTAVFNFTNNTTITSWYSTVGAGTNEGRSSGGSAASTGSIYNWGRTADRALGTFAQDGYGGDTEYFGVQFLNNTGDTISSLKISYVVEQWRRNANATTWSLQYLVTSSSTNELGSTGFTTVVNSTIQSSTGSAGGRNGNFSGNQTTFDLTVNELEWNDGEYLWLRWTNNQGASSGGLGLDDLNVSAIPEVSSAALMGTLSMMFLVYRSVRQRC